MLHLICAPSGFGKTEEIISRIKRDVESGTRCFLIVPEQQAYISERDLLLRLPPNAGLYLKIANFSGLAEDVLRTYGGIAERKAGNGARAVLMWKTLHDLAPLLKQYKSAGADTGLTGKMLALIEELRASSILPEQLEEAAKALPDGSPLAKKLSDIALIDATFRSETEALFGSVGTNDRLLKVAELLADKDYFSHCNIYVDSFTSFTHPEYVFLERLMKQADSVTVALCSDQPYSAKPHFKSLTATTSSLIKHANRAGCAVKDETPNAPTRQRTTALCGVEAHLWNFAIQKDELKALRELDSSGIHALVCSNTYEEAEACALNIEGLVQSGISYGEIAVVMRDAEAYRGILDAALERHGIPYFFSERSDLASMPLSRLILSALRVIGKGYKTQDVLSLLKTGLTGVTVRDAALFEEYCNTWHISGKRFHDPVWSMNPDGLTDKKSERGKEILDAANRAREILIEPLKKLQANFHASKLLAERCRAIYAYLCDLNISEKLSQRARHELSLGQTREAGETVRLYQFVLDALTELCTLLPDSEVNTDELLSLLTLFFSGTDLGSVPNAHDCVMVGSADLLRVEDVKASFLLGLCEGEFPRALSDDSLLTEAEKSALEKLEKPRLPFNRRADTLYSDELFYVYRAMTKPSEQLFLSYPAMQTDGSLRSPSLAFNRVKFLFDLTEEAFDLSQILQNTPNNTENFDSTVRKSMPLSERTLYLSSSSVQSFALCPYRYYASHPLGLRDQKDSDISAADEGTFLHFIFESFLRSALNDDGSISLPPTDQIPKIADGIIEDYLARVCPIPVQEMDGRLLHLFERLRGLALVMLGEIVTEIASGDFIPSRFEQVIGGKSEKDLPSVRIPLKSGAVVELRGLVDRVDFYRLNGKIYVRIVDYKTGTHEFSTEDVANGLDIQLVLYLFAVLSSNQKLYVPAGAQFLYSQNVKNIPCVGRSGFLLNDDEIVGAADSEGLYAKGVKRISGEKIDKLISDMTTVVTQIGEQILAGEANKTPSERACLYCPLIDLCDVACRKKY